MPNEIIQWKPAAFFDGRVFDTLKDAQEAALLALLKTLGASDDVAVSETITLLVDNADNVIGILQASPNAPKRIGRPKGSKTRKPATEPPTEDKK